ncbi:MAG TPA: hypothetical protein VIM31_01380 [Candidatus Microsaccharimonas sp.]|jgi:hypothetical protein
MSPEFNGSSKHEHSKLYDLKPSTIKGFAERTENQALLEKFLYIMAERALAEEFNIEADETALFIHKKLEDLRQKDRDDAASLEAAMERHATEDYYEARKFFEVYPQFYLPEDPELAELEREHEALFKQQ